MSSVLIWVLVVVVIVALAGGVTVIFRAGRSPAGKHQHAEERRGQVQGGTHVGGGRSVGPRRDAGVIPDADPESPTVAVRKTDGPLDL